MVIERLDSDQWQRFRQIRMTSLRESPDAFGSTYAEAQARNEASWKQQLEEIATFVAVCDGIDVGVVRGFEPIGEVGVLASARSSISEHRRALAL